MEQEESALRELYYLRGKLTALIGIGPYMVKEEPVNLITITGADLPKARKRVKPRKDPIEEQLYGAVY